MVLRRTAYRGSRGGGEDARDRRCGPGLGSALARRFAREGWSVALVALRQDVIDAGLAELEGFGVKTCGAQADVADRDRRRARLRLDHRCPRGARCRRLQRIDLPGRAGPRAVGRGAPACARHPRRRRAQHRQSAIAAMQRRRSRGSRVHGEQPGEVPRSDVRCAEHREGGATEPRAQPRARTRGHPDSTSASSRCAVRSRRARPTTRIDWQTSTGSWPPRIPPISSGTASSRRPTHPRRDQVAFPLVKPRSTDSSFVEVCNADTSSSARVQHALRWTHRVELRTWIERVSCT